MAKPVRKSNSSKRVLIKFAINNIDLISKNLPFLQEMDYSLVNEKYLFYFESIVNLLSEEKIIKILIVYKLKYENSVLFEMNVSTDFFIENFKDAFKKNEKSINEDLLYNLIEIAIGHSRGIQSTLTKGSQIQNFYLPLLPKQKILENLTISMDKK